VANYTTDEITAAVEKVVRSSIRRTTGALGNRDGQMTFNDMQDAVAGILILKPNSPFYISYLGAQRLLELLPDQYQTLVDLVEAINNTDRLVSRVDNLAPLANAKSALQALESAAAARNKAFGNIEDVPAFKRYDQNIQTFLDNSSSNIRSNGEVVPTPQEARESLAGYARTVEEQQAEIINRARYLSSSVEDYDSLELPSLLASGVTTRARQVLSNRLDELNALSAEDRLAKMKEVTLDLVAGRAAVQGLTSLRASTMFALIEGSASVFADADHPATPATAKPDIYGPYPVTIDKNELYFKMNSSFSFTALLPGSFIAYTDCGASESDYSYDFESDNNILLIDAVKTVDETVGRLTVTFNTAGVLTAEQVASEINTAIGTDYYLQASTVLRNLRFNGLVDITVEPGMPDLAVFTLTSGSWSTLGVAVGDRVRILDGDDEGKEFTVGEWSGAVMKASGAVMPTPALLVQIEVGATKTVRLQVTDAENSLTLRRGFTIVQDTGNTATSALGLIRGSTYRCKAVSADLIKNQMDGSYSAQKLGVPQLVTEVELVPYLFEGLGRSNPDDTTKIVAYKFRGYGSTSGGTDVVFTVSGALTAGVIAGDILVIRETTIVGDFNKYGTVTEVTDTSITATFSSTITEQTDSLVEVGPDLSFTSAYLDFRVTDSELQDGDYSMAYVGQGAIPFEFTLEGPLPSPRGLNGTPQLFNLSIGQKRPTFSSVDTTLITKVELNNAWAPPLPAEPNPGVALLFTGGSVSAVGTSVYLLLPEDPKSLSVEGDILEIYETTTTAPDAQDNIVDLDLDNLLIELETGLDTDHDDLNMSLNSPLPYARIRLGRKNNYTVLKEALEIWLEDYSNSTAWFVELNRLLNPLIVNKNPTLAQINTAKQHVELMLGLLTEAGANATGMPPTSSLEAILGAFSVKTEESVDNMVQAYLEQGSDRAIDILLQGRFLDFFGLTTEGMSYGGAMRESLRDIAREDLPVRKVGRMTRIDKEQITATYEDVDYEKDFSDAENLNEDIEFPGSFDYADPTGR